jgi:hypothetical protein
LDPLRTLATLPLVIEALLLEIAVGGFVMLLWTGRRESSPRGPGEEDSPARNFLRTGGPIVLLMGVLALAASVALSVPSDLRPPGYDPRVSGVAVGLEVLFLLGVAAYSVGAFRSTGGGVGARDVAAAGAGGLALAAVALQDGGLNMRGLALLLSWGVVAAALGAILMATVLGHGYLVTPKLSERPLVRLIRIGLLAQAVQALLLLAGLPAGMAAGALLLSGAFWLRLLLGLVLPVGINLAALQCARMRSMQSATGLLYISMSLMFAGEIPAKVLVFLGRMLT